MSQYVCWFNLHSARGWGRAGPGVAIQTFESRPKRGYPSIEDLKAGKKR